VRNLLTIGTPNMGFTEIPREGCMAVKLKKGMVPLCEFKEDVEKHWAYTPTIQKEVYYAGFYRDANNLDEYKQGSSFLSALNNEVGITSHAFEKHRTRMEKLHGAMFVMFDKDEMVLPANSEIFGQLSPKDKDGN